MAWIKTIEEDEAEGRLSAMYQRLLSPHGIVDNILKIHSLNPLSLEAHLQLYKTLMFRRSELSRRQREMIAVAVSAVNDCHY